MKSLNCCLDKWNSRLYVWRFGRERIGFLQTIEKDSSGLSQETLVKAAPACKADRDSTIPLLALDLLSEGPRYVTSIGYISDNITNKTTGSMKKA